MAMSQEKIKTIRDIKSELDATRAGVNNDYKVFYEASISGDWERINLWQKVIENKRERITELEKEYDLAFCEFDTERRGKP